MRERKLPPVPVYLSPRHLLEENDDDFGAGIAADADVDAGADVDVDAPCWTS